MVHQGIEKKLEKDLCYSSVKSAPDMINATNDTNAYIA